MAAGFDLSFTPPSSPISLWVLGNFWFGSLSWLVEFDPLAEDCDDALISFSLIFMFSEEKDV